MRGATPRSRISAVIDALALLVGIAVGARVVYELLEPLLPAVVATVMVLGLIYVLFRRR